MLAEKFLRGGGRRKEGTDLLGVLADALEAGQKIVGVLEKKGVREILQQREKVFHRPAHRFLGEREQIANACDLAAVGLGVIGKRTLHFGHERRKGRRVLRRIALLGQIPIILDEDPWVVGMGQHPSAQLGHVQKCLGVCGELLHARVQTCAERFLYLAAKHGAFVMRLQLLLGQRRQCALPKEHGRAYGSEKQVLDALRADQRGEIRARKLLLGHRDARAETAEVVLQLRHGRRGVQRRSLANAQADRISLRVGIKIPKPRGKIGIANDGLRKRKTDHLLGKARVRKDHVRVGVQGKKLHHLPLAIRGKGDRGIDVQGDQRSRFPFGRGLLQKLAQNGGEAEHQQKHGRQRKKRIVRAVLTLSSEGRTLVGRGDRMLAHVRTQLGQSRIQLLLPFGFPIGSSRSHLQHLLYGFFQLFQCALIF